MLQNYFFVDGSALLGDIHRIHTAIPELSAMPLNLLRFAQYFTGDRYARFHGNEYKRFVFYFVKSDERIKSLVELPNPKVPDEMNDVRIEYCGRRVRGYSKARAWLEKNLAPEYVYECFYRGEKAVDTQICCDALQLGATGRLDRLFLYTNDFDFVPLCRTLRGFGVNVNLFRLRAKGVNKDLVSECDVFHAMERPDLLTAFATPPSKSGGVDIAAL